MATGRELPTSFQDALQLARRILSASDELVARGVVDTEAEQLVMAAYRATGGGPLSRVELFSRVGDRYPGPAGEKLIVFAMARAEGKILQHVIGTQLFLEHEYEVSPDVLVPRQETEVLITHALRELDGFPAPPRLGLEIGVGSGILSIELLARFPSLRMLATEFSAPAADCAARNATRVLGAGDEGARRLTVARVTDPRHVFEDVAGRMEDQVADFLISNPPYLTKDDPIDADVLRHEPARALFAPEDDPLFFYRRIAEGGAEWLRLGGRVFLEIPDTRSAAIARLFKEAGWTVKVLPDLTGRDRVLIAGRPGGAGAR